MIEADFFGFSTEESWLRTICIFISTIYLILSPPFLLIVIRYEKNIHRRTILNYLACDFCYVFICSYVSVQTFEIGRFIIGPLPHRLCYVLTSARGILVNSFIWIINFQAIIKYVLIFIWKSPFIFRDDFWYFFTKMIIIFIVFLIQFVVEFLRRFQTFEFYFCAGLRPEAGNGPRYISLITMTITVGLQLALFLRKFFYWRSQPNQHIFNTRISDIEMDSVLNVFSTVSATVVLCLASLLFFAMSKGKPEEMGTSPYIYLLFWRVFLYPPFSSTLVFIMIFKNKKFRTHLRNLITNNTFFITLNNCFYAFLK